MEEELPDQETSDPGGLWRLIDGQTAVIDAMCGRVSCLGLGDPGIVTALTQAADQYLGDACRIEGGDGEVNLAEQVFDSLGDLIGHDAPPAIDLKAVTVFASTDGAMEKAVWSVRGRDGGQRFRAVSLIGSDHGNTTLCRTASGRPESQAGFGPMIPGFHYAVPGDIDDLRSCIDEATACVILSPVDLHDAVRMLEADYMIAARKLCDEQDIKLIVDESRVVAGTSGRLLAFSAIADIRPDFVVLSAGLFGGLPASVLLGDRVDEQVGQRPAELMPGAILPAHLLLATLRQIRQRDLIAGTQRLEKLATDVAETIGDFEFVRDIRVLGTTFGIDTDIPAEELVRAMNKAGLLVEAAGDSSIRMQLPIAWQPSDFSALLDRLSKGLDAIKRHSLETEFA